MCHLFLINSNELLQKKVVPKIYTFMAVFLISITYQTISKIRRLDLVQVCPDRLKAIVYYYCFQTIRTESHQIQSRRQSYRRLTTEIGPMFQRLRERMLYFVYGKTKLNVESKFKTLYAESAILKSRFGTTAIYET